MKATVHTHVPRLGPHHTAGAKPEPICDDCGNPRSHAVHQVPDDADARALDARKLGEGGDE